MSRSGRSADPTQQFGLLAVELLLADRADGDELVQLFDHRKSVLAAPRLAAWRGRAGKARGHRLAHRKPGAHPDPGTGRATRLRRRRLDRLGALELGIAVEVADH